MLISDYTLDDFIVEFCRYDRDYYSHDGYEYLLDTLQEISPSQELDVIGVCCDWTEYNDIDELAEDYGYLVDDINDLVNEISNRSILAELDNGSYMVAAF